MSDRRLTSKQVAALVIVAALAGYVMGRLSTNLRFNLEGTASGPDTAEFVRDDPGPLSEDSDLVPVSGAPFVGPGSAKVTIVLFSDFQCPYCSRANPLIHELLESYEDDLRLVFRHLPLPMHPDAMPAARAAVAAHQQGQFWAYHDLLFANQRALDRTSLLAYAEELDLDTDAFESAMDSEEAADAVAADMALADRLGLNGTPSFLVNGVPVIGALPVEEFRRVIDREIESADALLDAGTPLAQVYPQRVAANMDRREAEPTAPEGDAGEEHPAAEAEAPAAAEDTAGGDAAPAAVPSQEAAPVPDGTAELTVYIDYADASSLALARTVEQLRNDLGSRLSVRYRPLADAEDARARTIAAALVQAEAVGRFADLHGFLVSAPAPASAEELMQWAESHGLDPAAFGQALEESAARQAVAAIRDEASRAGIVLAPAVHVGSVRLAGAVPYEDLRVAVNAAMESP